MSKANDFSRAGGEDRQGSTIVEVVRVLEVEMVLSKIYLPSKYNWSVTGDDDLEDFFLAKGIAFYIKV